MKSILKCQSCGSYTMKETCKCGGKAVTPKPLKYSPADKYQIYRLKTKFEQRREKGLI